MNRQNCKRKFYLLLVIIPIFGTITLVMNVQGATTFSGTVYDANSNELVGATVPPSW